MQKLDGMISAAIDEFLASVASRDTEIYNEASVQYELAIVLRQRVGTAAKVQLERNVSFFGLDKAALLKREMDIVVFTPDDRCRHCIEIKYPTNGQHPEQMFAALKDVRFLEQLVEAGFGTCHFLMLAEDPGFWDGHGSQGVYAYFRCGVPVAAGERIVKPTGRRDQELIMTMPHDLRWSQLSASPDRRAIVHQVMEP